ncbi:TPA_asm: MC047L [Molluscum contagiosum virus]|uniref:MC047L n=2 Tax=Molluscum contagiosum virus TaxID=10279 RepID=A0A7G5AX47_MCV1|nr:MC047 [Molluscum contagiosum virus subtype 1]QHW17852.1 MC047L [Molluscum contagiosum virus]AQY17154.1 MC047 [Molluscum contagiosum virus subtype 1]AYO87506.1 MC047 [Molluscum contagiosum virus subtype 1]AYO88365.1 MC047 [Molluscum contagiosum virus subtype 1]
MALPGKDIVAAVALTVLMLLMVVSGGALVTKGIPPLRLLTLRSARAARAVAVLEVVAVVLIVPGTLALYSAYVRQLWARSQN